MRTLTPSHLCLAAVLGTLLPASGAPAPGPSPMLGPEILTPSIKKALKTHTGKDQAYTVADLEALIASRKPKPAAPNPADDSEKEKEPTPVDRYDARPAWTKHAPWTEPVIRMKRVYTDENNNKETVYFGPGERDYLEQIEKYKGDERPYSVPSARSRGRLRLRGTIVDRGDLLKRRHKIENHGMDPEITEVEGATFSFSDNRLPDGDREWNTQGALYMPFDWVQERTAIVPAHGEERSFGSTLIHMTPGAEWKYHRADKDTGPDVNELKFSVPLSLDTPINTNGGFLTVTAEPFYQTDFDFDGGILGALSTISYRGELPLIGLVNDWRNLVKGPDTGWYKQIILEGNVNYSDVQEGSVWMGNRQEGDRWLRAGGKAGLLVKYKPKHPADDPPLYERQSNVIDFRLTYQWLDTISGDGDSSDYFDTKLTYWVNDFAGITAQYQRGDTPVAEADIDLLTFGIELRY